MFWAASYTSKAQNSQVLTRELSEFLTRVSTLNGSIYIDTSYDKLNLNQIDTTELQQSALNARSVIKAYNLELSDFNFASLKVPFGHLFSNLKKFYHHNDQLLKRPIYDSIYAIKLEIF